MDTLTGLPRTLDLSRSADVDELRTAASGDADLLKLLQDQLQSYLALCPNDAWQRVYSGGIIPIPTGEKKTTGYHLKDLLRLAESLRRLEAYHGYARLIEGFRNPPQVQSTVFEVTVAHWCATRSVSRGLEFSPAVTAGGRRKYPEFRWHTEFGSVYCECKMAHFLESACNRRLDQLTADADRVHQGFGPWDPSLRLDLHVDKGSTNGIKDRFRSVVSQAWTALRSGSWQGEVFREKEVSAVLRARSVVLPHEHDVIRAYAGLVGPVATPVFDAAHISLTMSLAKYRRDAAAHLLREARSQLPSDSSGAVFLELGGYLSAQAKVASLIDQPTYVRTPWVSIWVHGELAAVTWRNSQPFDNRLLA
jgi:hypothetical protein